ncbi:ABC-type Fe3+/spermidine/putrescine transport system ATPase subunit [Rhodanobacter sp. ANJX3]|jgi:ABC-type Fe3+/spermidine/putrescine transport system ATPase subunit|uniref:hypothetical protein n=1 Tax=unclassified Rhodanobacter TaxID=2621553 RepID=UPI0015CE2864|nr:MULTISPECIES: hypothetical protein [unclassified Rhodanobacter]MBB5360616.1 ABC-type Fe3+/spermidine/putrescine transport system ATPase subunit [Rhodanobacter sp. ANJX3]NYE30626.1 ABC-type Fe3+/spermidine/putrescine transport system ATPase subunit [Rhodanobacter sp. K2T2]
MSKKIDAIEAKIAKLREQLKAEQAADRERDERELLRLARAAGCTRDLIRIAQQKATAAAKASVVKSGAETKPA